MPVKVLVMWPVVLVMLPNGARHAGPRCSGDDAVGPDEQGSEP
jgi:hypothetical protein